MDRRPGQAGIKGQVNKEDGGMTAGQFVRPLGGGRGEAVSKGPERAGRNRQQEQYRRTMRTGRRKQNGARNDDATGDCRKR